MSQDTVNQTEGETNPQELPEGETPSQETPQCGFDREFKFLDEHLGSERVRIDSDFELSKKCLDPKKSGDSIMEDSYFTGKDHKPFKKVVLPFATEKESASLPKGVDYRQKNDSSLL